MVAMLALIRNKRTLLSKPPTPNPQVAGQRAGELAAVHADLERDLYIYLPRDLET